MPDHIINENDFQKFCKYVNADALIMSEVVHFVVITRIWFLIANKIIYWNTNGSVCLFVYYDQASVLENYGLQQHLVGSLLRFSVDDTQMVEHKFFFLSYDLATLILT